jgi:hypothetical protein
VLLKATELTLKLHVVSAGIPAQSAGDSGIVPVYPFIALNVNIVVPLPPGLGTVIEVGFAVTVNIGPVTVSVAAVGVDAGR